MTRSAMNSKEDAVIRQIVFIALGLLVISSANAANGTTAGKQMKAHPAFTLEMQGKSGKAKAAKLWQQDADKGDAYAQYRVGLNYYKGMGVKKNIKMAKLWLGRSAKQGYSAAIILLKQINDKEIIAQRVRKNRKK